MGEDWSWKLMHAGMGSDAFEGLASGKTRDVWRTSCATQQQETATRGSTQAQSSDAQPTKHSRMFRDLSCTASSSAT